MKTKTMMMAVAVLATVLAFGGESFARGGGGGGGGMFESAALDDLPPEKRAEIYNIMEKIFAAT